MSAPESHRDEVVKEPRRRDLAYPPYAHIPLTDPADIARRDALIERADAMLREIKRKKKRRRWFAW